MGQRYVNWKQEVAYKDKALPWTVVGGILGRQFLEFELDPQQNVEVYQESLYREPSLEAIFGGFVGNANMKMLGRPDAMTYLFKWAFGSYGFAIVAATANRHTYNVGETLKSFALELNTGLSADSEYFEGTLIKSLQWAGTDAKEMLVDVEMQYAASLQAPSVESTTFPSVRPFKLTDCVFALADSAAVKATSITSKIENTIPDDRHTSGSREFAAIDVEACKISGEADIRFESWDQMDDYFGTATGAPGDEVLPVALTQTWEAGDIGATGEVYTFLLTCPAVVITGLPTTITGRESLYQRVSWEALYDASNEVQIINEVATAA